MQRLPETGDLEIAGPFGQSLPKSDGSRRQNAVGGKKIHRKLFKYGEKRRKLGQQLDGNDPNGIEDIFFHHQLN